MKYSITKKQAPNKFQYSMTNYQTAPLFGNWNLVVGYCLAIVSWFLVIVMIWGNAAYAEDFVYNSKGKRDPFAPLVGASAVYEVKEAANINSIEDVSLEGILYDEKGGSSAILNGMVLKEGNQIGSIVIDKIEPKKVILFVGEEKHEVALGKEKGGEER